MRSRIALPIALLMIVAAPVVRGAPPSGHINWGSWSFDWIGSQLDSGLTLRNVRYGNETVLYRASLPVVRVQYSGNACGPYADKLTEYSLQPVPWCGSNQVCQRTFTSGGRNWLEVGILVAIGNYRMYQAWYLSDDGYIHPHLFSKGLQCNIDHDHHPYWRLDFDIAGFPSDQLFVYDSNRPNQGWGPGWAKHDTEFNETKSAPTDRVWFVRDNNNGHGAWILPGASDGSANVFSSKDGAGRRYKGAEDEGWPFGAWGHLGYNEGEGIAETDVVFWYAAHMLHAAAEGPDVWHSVGPWIKVHR